MSQNNEHDLTELLYAAIHSPMGIVVWSNSPERLRQRLYAMRKSLMDDTLSALSFTISPSSPDTELWIIKKA